MVCDEMGGGSSNHHPLHLLFTVLHTVRQVVLRRNITAWVNLHIPPYSTVMEGGREGGRERGKEGGREGGYHIKPLSQTVVISDLRI